jgi:RNAse (barnase) inhibitor barstar
MSKKFMKIFSLFIIALVACGNGEAYVETAQPSDYTIARLAMDRIRNEIIIPQGQAGAFDVDATIVQALYDDETFVLTTEINWRMITDGYRTERLLTWESPDIGLGKLQLYALEEGDEVISFMFFVDGVETYYDERYANLGIESLWDILSDSVPNMPIERLLASTIEITENENTVIEILVHAQEDLDYVRDLAGDYVPNLANLEINIHRTAIVLDSDDTPQGFSIEMRFQTYRNGTWTGTSSTNTFNFNAFGDNVEIYLPL